MNAPTPEHASRLCPACACGWHNSCTNCDGKGCDCRCRKGVRVEEPAGEPCERDPNEVEELLRVSRRALGDETVCPDCGFRPGQHGWRVAQSANADVREDEHFYVYAITFDVDTFGVFATREQAEQSKARQIAKGGPAWPDCDIERWKIEGRPEGALPVPVGDAKHLAEQIIAFREGAPDADDAIYWLDGICREARALLDRLATRTPEDGSS